MSCFQKIVYTINQTIKQFKPNLPKQNMLYFHWQTQTRNDAGVAMPSAGPVTPSWDENTSRCLFQPMEKTDSVRTSNASQGTTTTTTTTWNNLIETELFYSVSWRSWRQRWLRHTTTTKDDSEMSSFRTTEPCLSQLLDVFQRPDQALWPHSTNAM